MKAISDQAIKEVHLAAQYLAAAGKSFLEHKADDSHTNLGFNPKSDSLETWPLDDQGLKLSLSYRTFSLNWQSDENELLALALDGKTHEEVLLWIKQATTSLGISEQYRFDLHYDLPYPLDQGSYFSKPLENDISSLLHNRKLAHTVMDTLVNQKEWKTSIRIWPHHFDSGGYELVEGIGIGFGMAIPDLVEDDFYLYCSGYKGHNGLSTSAMQPLSKGKWLDENFMGAVLPITELTDEQALTFFEEVIENYKSQIA